VRTSRREDYFQAGRVLPAILPRDRFQGGGAGPALRLTGVKGRHLYTGAHHAEKRQDRPVDVGEAARLYEVGHTIAEVAAILRVAPRTVVRNFDKAGIPRRPRGTIRRDVPVSEIQRLRDKGLTMPQVAEALGITISLAWRSYRRRQPVSDDRVPMPSIAVGGRLGRWQAALIEALSSDPAIAVNHVVARHLGREPTHAELVAAQRAAHRLTEHYQVKIAHVSAGRVASRGAVLLAREDQHVTDQQLVIAARKPLPDLPEQPPSAVADQLIDELASALAAAAAAAQALANHHLDDTRSEKVRRLVEGLTRDLVRSRRQL
jgi:hypothetical protein